MNEAPPHLHTSGICFGHWCSQCNLQTDCASYRCICERGAWVCVFAFGTERRDQVLIKSNRVDLSSGCNQLPQCALSSPANGCFVVCYVDWCTHTSLQKWISGIKEPLLSSPMHPPIFLWCKWPIRYIYDSVEQLCQAIPQDIWGSDIWRYYSWIYWTVQSPAAIFFAAVF